jgi:hypothetical protein
VSDGETDKEEELEPEAEGLTEEELERLPLWLVHSANQLKMPPPLLLLPLLTWSPSARMLCAGGLRKGCKRTSATAMSMRPSVRRLGPPSAQNQPLPHRADDDEEEEEEEEGKKIGEEGDVPLVASRREECSEAVRGGAEAEEERGGEERVDFIAIVVEEDTSGRGKAG